MKSTKSEKLIKKLKSNKLEQEATKLLNRANKYQKLKELGKLYEKKINL